VPQRGAAACGVGRGGDSADAGREPDPDPRGHTTPDAYRWIDFNSDGASHANFRLNAPSDVDSDLGLNPPSDVDPDLGAKPQSDPNFRTTAAEPDPTVPLLSTRFDRNAEPCARGYERHCVRD